MIRFPKGDRPGHHPLIQRARARGRLVPGWRWVCSCFSWQTDQPWQHPEGAYVGHMLHRIRAAA